MFHAPAEQQTIDISPVGEGNRKNGDSERDLERDSKQLLRMGTQNSYSERVHRTVAQNAIQNQRLYLSLRRYPIRSESCFINNSQAFNINLSRGDIVLKELREMSGSVFIEDYRSKFR